MAKQVININSPSDLINVGLSANDSRGDPLRSAFIKLNDAIDKIDLNFTELYNQSQSPEALGNFVFTNNSVTVDTAGELQVKGKSSSLITLTIDNITNDAVCEVFASPSSGTLFGAVSEGYKVKFSGITTMSELNDNSYYIKQSTATSFFLYIDKNLTQAVDSTNYTAYISSATRTATNINPTGGTEFRADTTATPNITAVQAGWTVSGPGLTGTRSVTTVLTSGNTYFIEIATGGGGFSPATAYTFTGPSVNGAGSITTSAPAGNTKLSGGNTPAIGVGEQGDLTLTGENVSIESNYNSWVFNSTGSLTLPLGGTLVQNQSFTRTTDGTIVAATPSVIWTGILNNIASVKLNIQVEGNETGDTSGWHTQSCEAVIACRWYGNSGITEPQMSVYGIIHTSVEPLATFTVQRNSSTNLIEVVATPTATANQVDPAYTKVYSVEMKSND